MTTRRQILKVLGGGVIVAAAGTTGWALTRDPSAARAPWAAAGGAEEDVRRKALSFAILAPNPHNRQPWLVDLGTPDAITLYCDETRKLAHTDPFDRQITVGLGAFLELLTMALAADSIGADIALFPEGEPQPRLDARPVARISLMAASATPDPLFAHVLTRRTNRLPYDTARPVSADLLTKIAAAARTARVGHTVAPEEVATLRDIGWRGMMVEFTTPATMTESVDLMRIGRRQIEANPDGISLAGPMMEALAVTGLFRPEELVDPTSPSFQRQMPFLKAGFDSAMACLWVITPGNTRADQISAGRDYVRLNLAATAAGLAMQPWSQTLQEFPEMAALAQEIRKTLGIAPQEGLQMLARLGYAADLPPSPRWPYETRILSS
jgi:hypothetical protein